MNSNDPNNLLFENDILDQLLSENNEQTILETLLFENLGVDLETVIHSTINESSSTTWTPDGRSPEQPLSSNPSTSSSEFYPEASSGSDSDDKLKVIAEPSYGKKLRYRSDFVTNQNRIGPLKNRTKNSNYQGPAISIPTKYLKNTGFMYVRVTLVTALDPRTNLRYIHPYELENTNDSGENDPENNSVWFRINSEDQTGVKSFPSLRIVKKTAPDLRAIQEFVAFNHNGFQWTDQVQKEDVSKFSLISAKKLIGEYKLDHTFLAFTLYEPSCTNNPSQGYQPLWHTTVFSQPMIEMAGDEAQGEQEIQSPVENVVAPVLTCRIQKYAPHYGFTTGGDEMIVVLTDKLELKKYGEVQVHFKCSACDPIWMCPAANISRKERLISFQVPKFPFDIQTMVQVEVIISQTNRSLGQCQYFYLPMAGQCAQCQHKTLVQYGAVPSDAPNKRSHSTFSFDDPDEDHVVTRSATASELHYSKSMPATSTVPKAPTEALTSEQQLERLMDKLRDMTNALFHDRNEKPLLLICRPFIKEHPELLHQALGKDADDLVLKYLPLAPLPVLRYRFQDKGTFLLHAVRLNRLDMVRILCESRKSEDFEKLIEDRDDQGNNLFHVLASEPTHIELLEWIIKHFEEKKISIGKLFDRTNKKDFTPLQTAICQNNRSAVRHLLKYFQTNVLNSADNSGDNLLHLAVRHGDLALVKCLIDEGNLSKQGQLSNLIQTPVDLAQALNRTEIIEYFQTVYPHLNQTDQSESSESESDDDEEDDDSPQSNSDHRPPVELSK